MSRQSILDKLTLNHETQIKKTLEDLEAQIISDIAEHKRLLSTQPFSPELLRQKTAITIQLRNDFKKQFQNIFLAESDSLIREYDQVVGEFMKEFGKLNIPDKFKNLTKVDLDTISALKTQTFQGFEEVANTYLTEINTNVYQNVIGGRSFDDMVRDISGKLTGAVDVAGRPMSSHAGQLAHDSIMQFDAQFVKAKASSAGLTHFRYAGTSLTTTRDFCQRHIGQVYSEEEIRSIWSGSWTGKSSGDPFVVRGGYRCRHTWKPVDPDWLEKEEKPKKKPKKNISSLSNPIKEKDITILPKSVVATELTKQITKNAKDKRYPYDDIRNRPVSRFQTTNIGKIIGLDKLDDEIATKLLVIMQELDDLAIKYNVPKLRSININARQSSIMSMGDGNLKINYKYFNKKNPSEKIQVLSDIKEVGLAKTFKLGDDVSNEIIKYGIYQSAKRIKIIKDSWKRPYNAFYYEDNDFDKMRSILYHEFGHQVHQMKNVEWRKLNTGYVHKVPVENALNKFIPTISKSSASRYSAKNTKEWFAENFSLYHMGKKDLVDPRFIEFLENEVMK